MSCGLLWDLSSDGTKLLFFDAIRRPAAISMVRPGGGAPSDWLKHPRYNLYPHRRHLAEGPGSFAYPVAIQAQDGKIHVIFTSDSRTVIRRAGFPSLIASALYNINYIIACVDSEFVL